MATRQAKVGDIVQIEFDDHIKGSDRFVRDFAWGRLAIIHREGRKIIGYTIDCWAPVDPNFDREEERQNIESFSIHKGTIHSIKILR